MIVPVDPRVAARLGGASVFLTGATGFIGSHLLERLCALGADPAILLRPSADASRIADRLDGVRVYRGDLADADRLRSMLEEARPRYVFHLAAYTQVGREASHAASAMSVNLVGTMNLLAAAQGLPIEAIVNSGTCEEYGDGAPPIDESAALRPVSPYSASKAAATLWCEMMYRSARAPVVTLRPFLCYGPAQEPVRLIPQAILAALAGRDFPMTAGEQTREFTHVSDIVEGYLLAAAVPEAVGEVINLGSGEEHRVRDLVERIYAIAGSGGRPLIGAVPYRAAELWRCVSNPGKAHRLLGWRPRIDLDRGLAQTIEWYRSRGAAASTRPAAQAQ